MGSPAFGTPPTIASNGRVPGFEGAGVVSEVGANLDPALGLKQGLRVAFFPASGAWSDEAVVPASSVVPLPDSIPDEVAAQMMINTLTALTVIRAAHDSLPPDARTGVVTLLTGAGSAVGRLIGKVLTERGVKVIRLVRSEASAAKLTGILPGAPVFVTGVAGWKGRVRAAAEGAKIQVAMRWPSATPGRRKRPTSLLAWPRGLAQNGKWITARMAQAEQFSTSAACSVNKFSISAACSVNRFSLSARPVSGEVG